jgi:hypothetical protein
MVNMPAVAARRATTQDDSCKIDPAQVLFPDNPGYILVEILIKQTLLELAKVFHGIRGVHLRAII